MHVADHPPAIGAIKPLQAVADDGGAQMTDMHRLGDVGAAEIDHHRLAVAGCGRKARALRQHGGARVQRLVGQIEIEKAGTGDLDLGEDAVGLQPRGDLFGNGAGIGFRRLRRRQRAIALELRQIGPVGHLHLAEMSRQALPPRTPAPAMRDKLAPSTRRHGT